MGACTTEITVARWTQRTYRATEVIMGHLPSPASASVSSAARRLAAPEWIPGVGREPGAGTPNDNLTLFSFQGTALPSVGIFRSPAAVCASYDPYDVPCVVP
jgi:hypothetical protein